MKVALDAVEKEGLSRSDIDLLLLDPTAIGSAILQVGRAQFLAEVKEAIEVDAVRITVDYPTFNPTDPGCDTILLPIPTKKVPCLQRKPSIVVRLSPNEELKSEESVKEVLAAFNRFQNRTEEIFGKEFSINFTYTL